MATLTDWPGAPPVGQVDWQVRARGLPVSASSLLGVTVHAAKACLVFFSTWVLGVERRLHACKVKAIFLAPWEGSLAASVYSGGGGDDTETYFSFSDLPADL